MSKKEEFKMFAKSHPELIKSVHSKSSSWQELYEIYDIYGDDDRAWQNYLKKDNPPSSINNFSDIVKKIDMDSVQKHINTAQKALDLVQELTGKSTTNITNTPVTPRPINKFFED